MPNSTDDCKKAKIKSNFKSCYFQYQDCEIAIKAAKLLKQQNNALETQEDDKEEEELSDVELYRKGPVNPNADSKFTWYLKQTIMP
jgi:hypothetical protein